MVKNLHHLTESTLHFGSSCGIVHVAGMVHGGQVLEALFHTIIIVGCIFLFAGAVYGATKIVRALSR